MHAAALVLAAAASAAAPIPSSPTTWVTDEAHVMSEPARVALDARLHGYERATGHQVVVWIGQTIGSADLADWAVRTFAAWKLGRAGQDDGIAIFVLAADRKLDIEVGYGLEDRVPDAIASRIIREVMTPKLRAGDTDGAITAGADAVLAAIEGKPWAGAAATTTPQETGGPSTLEWILGGAAVVAFLILAIANPRMAMALLWSLMWMGRRRGDGGFGGGDGGFGGGGGRSGGGGARGGW